MSNQTMPLDYSDLSLSKETLERIGNVRSDYELLVNSLLSTCVEGPERTVALRLLQESFLCASKCVLPDENPFMEPNLMKRGEYMKKYPSVWKLKMKAAGLGAPYEKAGELK